MNKRKERSNASLRFTTTGIMNIANISNNPKYSKDK
jgi:hypothetical protein